MLLFLPFPALQHAFVHDQAYISHRSRFFLIGFRKRDGAQLCLSWFVWAKTKHRMKSADFSIAVFPVINLSGSLQEWLSRHDQSYTRWGAAAQIAISAEGVLNFSAFLFRVFRHFHLEFFGIFIWSFSDKESTLWCKIKNDLCVLFKYAK